MATFTDRASIALFQFNVRLTEFSTRLDASPVDATRLPKKALADLRDAVGRAGDAAAAIGRSFVLIDQTALDIVDMQVRLQGETARLASALRDLGEAVEKQHFIRVTFEDALVALDEAAELVAAAVFPSAVQGLRDVNVKLWDFEKIQWKRYTDLLTTVVQSRKITSAQQLAIQRLADDVAAAFADVNTLLNELAESRASDAAALRKRLQQAPEKLMRELAKAEARMRPEFGMFAPIIKASGKIADEVARLLRKLVIPIYPTHAKLADCAECIDAALYDSLSGVQMFALLNILARMQATTAAGKPLVAGRHVRVVEVFPDRIYFEADHSLIVDMGRDAAFKSAPASLHKFRDGSFKQSVFSRGNLQVCFAAREPGRVIVDADIDLYRGTVRHLFGEVLVNHLTGNTTSQFSVREILESQQVAAIGGFNLLAV